MRRRPTFSLAARLSHAEKFPDKKMNKSHSILPLSSFILFLRHLYAALDESSRPKISIATVFRLDFQELDLSRFFFGSVRKCGRVSFSDYTLRFHYCTATGRSSI